MIELFEELYAYRKTNHGNGTTTEEVAVIQHWTGGVRGLHYVTISRNGVRELGHPMPAGKAKQRFKVIGAHWGASNIDAARTAAIGHLADITGHPYDSCGCGTQVIAGTPWCTSCGAFIPPTTQE